MSTRWIWSAIAAGILMGSGCTSFSLPKNDSLFKWIRNPDKDKEPQTPHRMAVMWTPDILAGAGHTPTRGFGARVYFYNDRGKPVHVDGDLIIHGFDDADVGGQNAGRRYRFTNDQLATHCSKSDIGTSYSFWLPWDALGGQNRRITLITSFQPKDGSRPVQSEAATVLLPGPQSSKHVAQASATTGPVPQQQPPSPRVSIQTTPNLGMETTTIYR